MVFRFTSLQDCEMLRELIRQKPFAAKRGATLDVWDNIAAALSSALKTPVKVKQIRDRLNLLKARFKATEQTSAVASGVEESLQAVNVQSHYSDADGLVREYMALERLHHDAKAAAKLSKEQKEEDLAQCAANIVAESYRRRADRIDETLSGDSSSSSEAENAVSSAESVETRPSVVAAQSAPKRSNAFLSDVKRQERRYKEQMELRVRELEQNQKQFEERLAFEKRQSEDRLLFESCVQSSNRDMILECAKIFGAALSKK
ncbi:hypothetical protein PF004_g15120 [Phytophthora fragariae]|uniref:Myb/SANT-like domain-containing protein n=1 Tax=Phytophthora fragariae TaxID=53985 RepID=A0A6G0NM77_9STRA|nr:hypothetical protein PF004_g15120 [Phytophthora fragariae]